MNNDITIPIGDGLVSLRVGAIILKDNKVLMVKNEKTEYLYSVGGRIQFGETAEEAVVREVYEETGVNLEVDRLGFVHENYFWGDAPINRGKLIYEVARFFYMKTPHDFEPIAADFIDGNSKEHLVWVPLDTDIQMYPEFFKTELSNPSPFVRYLVTDDRRHKFMT